MADRLDLHWIFVDILGTREEIDKRVYFQPPSTIKMKYPCIIYTWDRVNEKFANDKLYFKRRRYQVTIVDIDPDSPFPDLVSELPYTSFENHFIVDNLNHFIYSIYF